MATRYGSEVYEWLLARGWATDPWPDEEAIGDPLVMDRETGRRMGIYQAASLHQERTGDYPEFLRGAP